MAEAEYIVEMVQGKRVTIQRQMVKGRPEYWIKWEGYTEAVNTWEPLTNLLKCMKIIARFENEQETLIQQKRNQDINECKRRQILRNLDATQGHFVRNDKPKCIKHCKNQDKKVFLTVQWEKRLNGFQPDDTIFCSSELKEHDKNLLIDFYESKLKLVQKKKAVQDIEKNQQNVQNQKEQNEEAMEEE